MCVIEYICVWQFHISGHYRRRGPPPPPPYTVALYAYKLYYNDKSEIDSIKIDRNVARPAAAAAAKFIFAPAPRACIARNDLSKDYLDISRLLHG